VFQTMVDQNIKLFDEWTLVLKSKDMVALASWLDEQVVFRSPAVFKPYQGKRATLLLLSNVIEVFEHFAYHRTWLQTNVWVLEFSAKIKDKDVHGVDIIEWRDGKIVRFDVLVRPFSGLSALREAMGARIGGAKL
jgi:hypothetical protein